MLAKHLIIESAVGTYYVQALGWVWTHRVDEDMVPVLKCKNDMCHCF